MKLEAMRVLLTGATGGIGRVMAQRLLEEGAHLLLVARDEAALGALVQSFAFAGDRVHVHPADITQPTARTAVCDVARQWHGGVNVLINNAGGQFPSPATLITARGFEAVVRNNLNGTFFLTREVAERAMIPQCSGVIINVIANIYRGFPGMAHTGAARAAVDNLTKSLSVEWAQFDVRINAVAPGVTITEMTTDLVDSEAGKARLRDMALGRFGRADEVADAVIFLLSDQAALFTGQTLNPNSGGFMP